MSDKKIPVSIYDRKPYQQMVRKHNTEPSSSYISRPQPNTPGRIFERDKLGRFLSTQPAYQHEYGKDIRLPNETKALRKALKGEEK